MPILKVFVDKSHAADVLASTSLIQRYDAFTVVEASEERARSIRKKFPVEDISADYQLPIGGRTINTLVWRSSAKRAGLLKSVESKSEVIERPHHYVVQFIAPIKQNWLARIRRLGAKPREHFKSFSYIVWIPPATLPHVAALEFVLWIGHLPYKDRIDPGLVSKPARETPVPRWRVRPNTFTLETFDSRDVPKIARSARALGFKVISTDPNAQVVLLETDQPPKNRKKQLQELSAVHGVRYVRERSIRRISNNVAVSIMGGSFPGGPPSWLNFAGEGEIVAVCDTGLDTGDTSTIHPDFTGRIVAIKSYPIAPEWHTEVLNPGANDGPADLDSGHGTHVAGSVLGNGAASAGGPALVRGFAYKAKLVFQAVEQEMKWSPEAPWRSSRDRYLLAGLPANLRPLFKFAYDHGARIHSNSWGGGTPRAYDEQCRQFDQFVWDNKDFCFVVAAGNDGTDRDGNGKINLGSITPPATAKNCITVGASENVRPEFNSETYGSWWEEDYPAAVIGDDPMANDRGQVAAFSSRGPTADQRVKPDVVAPGTFILSTRSTVLAANNYAWEAYPPNKRYFHMGGTSMATPLTAGALAVLREFVRKAHGNPAPSAALMKALLIAGAERLQGTAATDVLSDNHQGFGRVNLDRTLRNRLLTIEGRKLRTGQKQSFIVTVPASGKTMRIVLAYTDAPGPALVNNLNLFVTSPSGRRWVGNQPLNSTKMTLDSVNNVEVIQRDQAEKGEWAVDILASNVSVAAQDFALAVVLI
jgi:subtilisin family serine protease